VVDDGHGVRIPMSCDGDRGHRLWYRGGRMTDAEARDELGPVHPDDEPADAGYGLIVVSNPLPVDASVDERGGVSWRRSPGGRGTAREPVMRIADGGWVGWPGSADLALVPFDSDGIRIVPVPLSADDLEGYYEGFSNDTLWPLYHDVIARPT